MTTLLAKIRHSARPLKAAMAALVVSSAALTLNPPHASAATAQVATHAAGVQAPAAVGDTTTKYFYAIGGTDPRAGCMQGETVQQTSQGPVVLSRWYTILCRSDASNWAGPGCYSYYNWFAGASAWFMTYCVNSDYTYWTDAANQVSGFDVWFRYPTGESWNKQIRLNRGSYFPLRAYVKLFPASALRALQNDALDTGIMEYVIHTIYANNAAAHLFVRQQATQAASTSQAAWNENNAASNALTRINNAQISADDQETQLLTEERYEFNNGVPQDVAAQQAAMDEPVCSGDC